MLQHYFKIGLRNIIKHSVFSTINIAGLAIGISCCIVILIFVRYESNFDSYHKLSEKTYRVVQHTNYSGETFYWNTTAYPLAEALRNDFPEMEMVTQAAGPFSRIFSVGDDQDAFRFEEDYVLFVDSFYPQVFDVEWLSGSPETALLEPNSVVLTESLARKCFSDVSDQRSVLGKILMLNNKDPLKVTGVIKDASQNSSLLYNMLIPYEFFKVNNEYFANNWSGNYGGTTFMVLVDKVKPEIVESKIADWKKKYLKPEDDNRISYFLQPIIEMHNETLYGGAIGSYTMPGKLLKVASLVALFILAIAIANFVNLVTAQSTLRSKEVGIRKVIGSSRFGLVNQFIFENTFLIIVTLLISTILAHFLLVQLNTSLSIFKLKLSLQWSDAGLILSIGLITILLATVYPAIVLSSFRPIEAIKNKTVLGNSRGFTLRKSLTLLQFTIVQLFVIASIIVAMQMNYFRTADLGFSSDAVVITPTPEFDKLELFRSSLLQNNNISKASFGSGPPMAVDGFQLGTTFRLPHQPKEEGLHAEMKIGDLNYLDFYGLELFAGRNFTSNKKDFDEFIVNERLIKSIGWTPEEAIGKNLRINEGEATIVGVVENFNNNSLQNDITPCIIMNWTYFQDKAFIKMKNGNSETLAAIEKTWKETFISSVYALHFLEDSIEKEYAVEHLVFKGFTVFSVLVITIGCLGLFGLMSFITLRKTKEIGIRKVLGASITQIVNLLSKEFVLLVALAFLIAAPLAYYSMWLWLQDFTYRIELSVWMFLGGGLLTLFIAMLTSGFHSVKAAVANPVDSLRDE